VTKRPVFFFIVKLDEREDSAVVVYKFCAN